MKFSTAIFTAALCTSAYGFAPSSTSNVKTSTTLNMADFKRDDFTRNSPRSSQSDQSEALPFLKRPPALDGELPGDVGFDPFGFAPTKEQLYWQREAEIKHGRLAMLAAVGWPISERFDRPIADALDMEVKVDASNRAPALLNGGLDRISPVYWAGILILAAAIDFYGIQRSRENPPGYFPGNLGWDPLGLYPEDEFGQRRMQLAEIKHGRLAMIAITAFAFQEFVQSYAVTDQTPIFFKPAHEVIDQYGQGGGLNPTL